MDGLKEGKVDEAGKEELLELCPFCGTSAMLFRRNTFWTDRNNTDNEDWDVKCNNDECYLSYGADWYLYRSEAIEMWNRRG